VLCYWETLDEHIGDNNPPPPLLPPSHKPNRKKSGLPKRMSSLLIGRMKIMVLNYLSPFFVGANTFNPTTQFAIIFELKGCLSNFFFGLVMNHFVWPITKNQKLPKIEMSIER